MQKWQLTIGLTGLALVASILAPRLLQDVRFDAPAHARDQAPPAAPAELSQLGPLALNVGLDHRVVGSAPEERFLVVEVRAPAPVGAQVRHPVDLAVVLDGSGSMSAAGKIDHARAAARHLAGALGPEDTYALVVFDDAARLVRPARPVTDLQSVERLIDGIYEGGGTNLHEGVRLGGAELGRAHADGRISRLVVLSDGKATVGVTDPARTGELAATLASRGVTVSTVGLGLDYNEDALAAIADMGGGTYDFVDDPATLRGTFSEALRHTASVVAQQSRVRLTLSDEATLLDVVGWETTAAGVGTFDIWLGDIAAGETRRIVARIRTRPAGAQVDVASVRLDYVHAEGAGYAQHHQVAPVADVSTAAASTDPVWAPVAQRAWGNAFLDRSTRAYAQGDMQQSRELLQQGRSALVTAARDLDAPELLNDAEDLDRVRQVFEHSAPSSIEGRRVIKSNKETFRGRVR
ncbi:MAG: Ca-activated chloride channel family protein [Myxococcota bacterium]|jgi:Ca-activated chloride channel family protein